MFEQQKKECLEKLYEPDKSKKGNVDTYVIPLIDAINQLDNYYTTSSCSGRISVFTNHGSEHKKDAQWLLVSHDLVSEEQVFAALANLPTSDVYFRAEDFILHVACKDLQAANNFVIFAQNNGYKNSSILSTKKFIVQIVGSRRFDTLIAAQATVLVSEDYLCLLVTRANTLLEKTHQGIDRLFANLHTLNSLK